MVTACARGDVWSLGLGVLAEGRHHLGLQISRVSYNALGILTGSFWRLWPNLTHTYDNPEWQRKQVVVVVVVVVVAAAAKRGKWCFTYPTYRSNT